MLIRRFRRASEMPVAVVAMLALVSGTVAQGNADVTVFA